MGDFANDLILGRACSDCGIYFEKEHGYPVLCVECHEEYMWEDDTNKIPKATISEL